MQFKSEKDGVVETRIERKIVTSTEGGDDEDDFDIDHDAVSAPRLDTHFMRSCRTSILHVHPFVFRNSQRPSSKLLT